MFIGTLFYLAIILLITFIIRWIRLIKVNSDEQVRQNEKIIDLLSELREKAE
ncbi:hypothetical protein [Halobacillus naozhouensis]|uniref:DUF4083 domain-containing protein n=1 Tax=Halobacillus naozhouensis TaxID=554880 RepID=A0ABY8IYU8_9BACI|nr:hypothetical protein [Halobacillus naozhouensis]WFT75407.1 hypothetical protein P9989_03135 [Halobacillus naozhouensis]